MTLATLARTTPALPSSPVEAQQPRKVGPGWEVLLMSEPLARLVARALAGRPTEVAPLGWVFAHAGQRGIFLPEESDDPAWPPGTTYLKAGASVTLPLFSQRSAERDGASGWVSVDGSPLSRPLLLHPVVTALATDLPGHASPPEPHA